MRNSALLKGELHFQLWPCIFSLAMALLVFTKTMALLRTRASFPLSFSSTTSEGCYQGYVLQEAADQQYRWPFSSRAKYCRSWPMYILFLRFDLLKTYNSHCYLNVAFHSQLPKSVCLSRRVQHNKRCQTLYFFSVLPASGQAYTQLSVIHKKILNKRILLWVKHLFLYLDLFRFCVWLKV